MERRELLYNAITGVNEVYLLEAEDFVPRQAAVIHVPRQAAVIHWRRWGALAAALVLAVSLVRFPFIGMGGNATDSATAESTAATCPESAGTSDMQDTVSAEEGKSWEFYTTIALPGTEVRLDIGAVYVVGEELEQGQDLLAYAVDEVSLEYRDGALLQAEEPGLLTLYLLENGSGILEANGRYFAVERQN